MRRLDTAEMKKEFQEKMMKQQERNNKNIKPETSKLDVKLQHLDSFKGANLSEETPFNLLEQGQYFGEIALLSNHKRTCSVRSMNNCIFATLDRSFIQQFQDSYPKIAKEMRESMFQYHDEEMEQRRRFILNIPIFTKM